LQTDRSTPAANFYGKIMKKTHMKKSLIALALGLSLGVAVSSGAQAQSSSTAGVPSAHNETMGSRAEDGLLTTKVKTALLAAKGLDSTGIHVHSRQGKVYLTGHVPSADQKALATQTAQGVSGVESVRTRLTLRAKRHLIEGASGSAGAQSDATHGETDAH